VATDLSGIARRLPSGLTVRVAEDADLERIVEFVNRGATPAQWQAPAAVRAMQQAAPEPLRLALIVEDAARSMAALAVTTDGGLWRAGDGTWRVQLLVSPEHRRRGVGGALLEQVEAHARAHAAPRAVAAVRGTDPEGARFAERHGYRAFHERIDAYIDVPAFDRSAFDDPDESARRVGIRLATWEELLAEHASDSEGFQRALLPILWQLARDVPSPTPMPEEPPPF